MLWHFQATAHGEATHRTQSRASVSDWLPTPRRGRELEPWRLSWTHITTHVIPANPPSKNGRIPNSLRGSSLPPNQVRLPPNQVQEVHLLVWRSPMWKCKKGGHFSRFSFFLFFPPLFTFYRRWPVHIKWLNPTEMLWSKSSISIHGLVFKMQRVKLLMIVECQSLLFLFLAKDPVV